MFHFMQQYTIVLDRTSGHKLGINLSSPDGETIVINSIAEEGLVEMWNAANPDQLVNCGDQIVEVNGVSVVAQTLLQQCESDDVLHMTIHRPNQIPASRPSKAAEEVVPETTRYSKNSRVSMQSGFGDSSSIDEAATMVRDVGPPTPLQDLAF